MHAKTLKYTSLILFCFFISIYRCGGTRTPQIITFKKNGGWCWFQDERAVLHDGILLIGSVADSSGYNGNQIDGNIEITAYDLNSKNHIGTSVLHANLESDDHNTPALLMLNDDRVLAVYSKHGTDSHIRYRMTKVPFNYLDWETEVIVTRDAGVTYSNLHFLENENDHNGRIYDFYRGENWNPNFVISDDNGKTWRYGGHLIAFDGRPYVKYISDGKNKIHFITTEHHPRNFNNSIYHAYIENDTLFQSDGSFIKALSDGPMSPSDGTRIFAGDSLNIGWPIDIHLDEQGFPFIAYSVQKNRNPFHIEYRYAKWDGEKWEDHFLAFGGTCLYEAESHYSGLVALNPDNPNVVYISTDKDPVKGTELISQHDHQRHYEIYEGLSTNNGQDWSWKPITQNSTFDNIRPIMPRSDGKYKVLLWLKGKYNSYTNYDLEVVGIVNP
ncbi:BNR-4 repeat-containing protein [bacterium]|nr:BNR-4 repeat-containing protein [bacterium]